MSSIHDLMKLVNDSNLSILDRAAVAEHVVTLAMDAVPEPQDDDPEVLKRMQPWEDPKLAALMGGGKGENLADAKAEVWKRHRTRAVLAIIANEQEPHVLREAACAWILADHPIAKWKHNNYDPQRLLAEMLPPSGTKVVAFGEKVPVERPPRGLQDLWRF